MYQGWICPITQEKALKALLVEEGVEYDSRVVSFPKGMIPSDPKIADKQLHLEILEKEVYEEDRELLSNIYLYDKSLRPEDFDALPSQEGKLESQIHIERDFHVRRITLNEKKQKIEQLKHALTQLNTDPNIKVIDPGAPLKIADSLIQDRFLHQQRTILLYCSDAFWRWNGVKYVECDVQEMRQQMYSFLRDAKTVNGAGQLVAFNPTKHKVDQTLDALRALTYLKHHSAQGSLWLDGREEPDPKFLISFCNGLFSVKDWLKEPPIPLLDHTPLLLCVNALDFDFAPNPPRPDAWLEFLDTIWPDDAESQLTLQEWFGYVLTQDTRQHKILLVVGPPRSGKGTIGRILRDLLGHFNVAGPTLSSLGGEFGLQPLLNKMLAVISDARLDGKGSNSIIIERLLSISGEDPLTINRKFLPPITTQLPTRLMIMSNELPGMRDSSGAIAKRFLVLTLNKSWLGREDHSLNARLRKELPGILLWVLEGLARLEQRGYFLQPSSSKQAIEELEALTSPVKAFVNEMCAFQSYATVAVNELFEAWRQWCARTGYQRPGTVQSFGKNLRAAFPDITSIRPQEDQERERQYKGIILSKHSRPSADVHGF